MTIRQYLLLMTICTIICWAGWLLVLFFINPETTTSLGYLLFYVSLFFAVVGTLAVLNYIFRLVFTRILSKPETVQVSFRQAIFFGLVIVVALFLQANNLMTWLNVLFLILLITIIEFLILSLKKEDITKDDGLNQVDTDINQKAERAMLNE